MKKICLLCDSFVVHEYVWKINNYTPFKLSTYLWSPGTYVPWCSTYNNRKFGGTVMCLLASNTWFNRSQSVSVNNSWFWMNEQISHYGSEEEIIFLRNTEN